jgi:hypothetical protein
MIKMCAPNGLQGLRRSSLRGSHRFNLGPSPWTSRRAGARRRRATVLIMRFRSCGFGGLSPGPVLLAHGVEGEEELAHEGDDADPLGLAAGLRRLKRVARPGTAPELGENGEEEGVAGVEAPAPASALALERAALPGIGRKPDEAGDLLGAEAAEFGQVGEQGGGADEADAGGALEQGGLAAQRGGAARPGRCCAGPGRAGRGRAGAARRRRAAAARSPARRGRRPGCGDRRPGRGACPGPGRAPAQSRAPASRP